MDRKFKRNGLNTFDSPTTVLIRFCNHAQWRRYPVFRTRADCVQSRECVLISATSRRGTIMNRREIAPKQPLCTVENYSLCARTLSTFLHRMW